MIKNDNWPFSSQFITNKSDNKNIANIKQDKLIYTYILHRCYDDTDYVSQGNK